MLDQNIIGQIETTLYALTGLTEEQIGKFVQAGVSAVQTEYLVWYDNGTGWYDCVGRYTATSEEEAIRAARSACPDLSTDVIVSKTDPNKH
ncbi:MAG TPA: hypothetical protein PLJ74_12650 [Myxococcota bacterium]|nr:hypothetical protein [Myxococcota bacterium]